MAIFNKTGHQYYNPTQWKDAPYTFPETPAHDWTAELERRSYFGNWLGRQNLLGSNNQSDLARSMYDRMEQGYEAGLFDNPEDKWVDYLDRHQYKMRDITASMDPESRGVAPNKYTGGARWLPRSG